MFTDRGKEGEREGREGGREGRDTYLVVSHTHLLAYHVVHKAQWTLCVSVCKGHDSRHIIHMYNTIAEP